MCHILNCRCLSAGRALGKTSTNVCGVIGVGKIGKIDLCGLTAVIASAVSKKIPENNAIYTHDLLWTMVLFLYFCRTHTMKYFLRQNSYCNLLEANYYFSGKQKIGK
jgi:hypothetical protein